MTQDAMPKRAAPPNLSHQRRRYPAGFSSRADVPVKFARILSIVSLACLISTGGWLSSRAESSLEEPRPRPVKEIEVTAQRFHFSPARIEVESGTRLEIRLRSRDTVHGFRIVGTDTNVLVPARGRGSATAVFDAEEPGSYEFECSKKCGAGHTQMRGMIVVKDPSDPGKKRP